MMSHYFREARLYYKRNNRLIYDGLINQSLEFSTALSLGGVYNLMPHDSSTGPQTALGPTWGNRENMENKNQ
ncbi:MAG: hypothetical protein MK316_05655, partial [Pseudomonadales bacterium]|nr:hypothetical protein [Pseudomonadales bacterium]